jgi:hypothetical protein
MCNCTRAWDQRNNHTDTVSKNTDAFQQLDFLRVPVSPPYLRLPEKPRNDLSLVKKNYFTTRDLCKVLKTKPDTLRYRFRAGYYPDKKWLNGKRVFSEIDIIQIVKVTNDLIEKGVIKGTKIII